MQVGPTELMIILIIALIVFGPRKLPELGKSLGHAMAQFRRASDDFKRSWEQEVELESTRKSEKQQTAPVATQTLPETSAVVHEPAHAAVSTAPMSSEPVPAVSASTTQEKPRSEHWI